MQAFDTQVEGLECSNTVSTVQALGSPSASAHTVPPPPKTSAGASGSPNVFLPRFPPDQPVSFSSFVAFQPSRKRPLITTLLSFLCACAAWSTEQGRGIWLGKDDWISGISQQATDDRRPYCGFSTVGFRNNICVPQKANRPGSWHRQHQGRRGFRRS